MKSVRVDVPGVGGMGYNVMIEAGAIDLVGMVMREGERSGSLSRKVGLVADENTAGLYGQRVARSLEEAGYETVSATLPAGERHKLLPTLLPVYDTFLSAKFERSTPIVAVGGGVVGDMAGFVAATLLRGVPFVAVPTTLLAMVDASVGGKTGVDHPAGKNLIGAFHQPSAVIIDPQVLSTLPATELSSGLAECIKHDIIRDADGFARLETLIDAVRKLDVDALTELIAHNVAIKAKVVAADPYERGERAHLNLGHTFGHAIETVSNYAYSHGQAVAYGICAAGYVSSKLGLLTEADLIRIRNLLTRAGLDVGGMTLDLEHVFDAMFFDKKVRDGRLRLILPVGIGRATIRNDVPPELIREAVESLST